MTPRYVYFLKPKNMEGPIKIGCSDTPHRRLTIFMAWSPFPLELIGMTSGTWKDEQYLHRCFADTHSHGEWFHSTPALREIIGRILDSSIDEVRNSIAPQGSIRKARKPKPPKTESQLLEKKYLSRIKATRKKLRVDNDKGEWSEPDDVAAIMYRWQGSSYKQIAAVHPSEMEIARLEEYLRNPKKHSVVPSYYRRKPSICIPVFPTEEIGVVA